MMNWLQFKIESGWLKPNTFSYFLWPISLFYRFVVFIRFILFRLGFFKSQKLSVPVIVIGNLTVGGTGKTPLVIAVAEMLKSKGYKPGIMSRGYKGNSKSWPRMVNPESLPSEVGDEPVLLARDTQVPVVVGPRRVESGQYLLNQFDCDVLISDDGFQHFALQRDLDIIVIDGDKQSNNHWCLPAGPYREPISSIKRAGIVVINSQYESKGVFEGLPQFQMRLDLQDAKSMTENRTCSLIEFIGKKVHAVAGIGHPQRFFKSLSDMGIKTINHAFADHHSYHPEDFGFTRDSLDNEKEVTVLMTEKDAVKCHWVKDSPQELKQISYWTVPVVAKLPQDFVQVLIREIT